MYFSQQVLDLHNNQISALPVDIDELKSLQVHIVELLLFSTECFIGMV